MKKKLIYGSVAVAGVIAILLFSSSSMAVPAKKSFTPPESDNDIPPEQKSSSDNVNKLLIPDVKLDRDDSVDLSYTPKIDYERYDPIYINPVIPRKQLYLDRLRTL